MTNARPVWTGLLLALGAVTCWARFSGSDTPPGAASPLESAVAVESAARGESTPLEAVTSFPILEPRTPADVRAVVEYCETAGADAGPELRLVALHAMSPLVAGNAIRALGRLRLLSPGDREMMALLRDPRVRIRQELIVALGQTRDPRAVPRLVPLLERDERAIRPLAIRALARIGDSEALAALAAFAPEASRGERSVLRDALGK